MVVEGNGKEEEDGRVEQKNGAGKMSSMQIERNGESGNGVNVELDNVVVEEEVVEEQEQEEKSRRSTRWTCSPRIKAVVIRIRTFLINQFLPVGLLVALFIGVVLPAPGVAVSSVSAGPYRVFPTLCIFFIFLLSGIAIQSKEVRKALRAGKATAFALISILVITPCAGFVSMHLGIDPIEFEYGMAVFSCVPTTLTSGVALVNSAGGNSVLALLLTVSSNLIGVGTVPFVTRVVLSSSSSASVDPIPLLVKLLISVLTPLVVGSLARASIKPLGNFAKKYKKNLSMLSNFFLMLIVWQTVSRSSDELRSGTSERAKLPIPTSVHSFLFSERIYLRARASVRTCRSKVMYALETDRVF